MITSKVKGIRISVSWIFITDKKQIKYYFGNFLRNHSSVKNTRLFFTRCRHALKSLTKEKDFLLNIKNSNLPQSSESYSNTVSSLNVTL